MSNAELKHLVELYWQVKKELDELRGNYERSDIDWKVFVKLEELCRKKQTESSDLDNKLYWTHLQEGFFYKEQDEVNQRHTDASKQIHKEDVKRKIDYLEQKLEAIKQLLGDDVIKQMEEYEKELILRHSV